MGKRKTLGKRASYDELKDIALLTDNWTNWKALMKEGGYSVEY